MNVKLYLLSSSLFFCSLAASAQRSMQAEEFPLGQYEELTDTKPHDSDAKWAAMKSPVMLSWASTDVRYGKHHVPQLANSSACTLKAWRGERVNAQAVLWTNIDLNDVELTMSDLRSGANVIPASKVRSHFVRYVMTDELNKDGKGGCGCRENKAEWDSSVVADALDINKWLPVQRIHLQSLSLFRGFAVPPGKQHRCRFKEIFRLLIGQRLDMLHPVVFDGNQEWNRSGIADNI